MSGHSKWNNIKRKKEKTDSQRAKVFTKIGRELAMAVKAGGVDPTVNSKLKEVIAKAKANNIPNDNIDRIIKKASGQNSGENYEAITYEGYGPSGVAIIVETLTDNRNRTAADLRHYFDKYGGNMGTPGCVSFMFDRKGVIVIKSENVKEEELLEAIMDVDVSDFEKDGEVFIIYTAPDNLMQIREVLENKFQIVMSELEMIPQTYVNVSNQEARDNLEKLLDCFENNEDVQNVWHNMEVQ